MISEWDKQQNLFSKEIRKIFGLNRRYSLGFMSYIRCGIYDYNVTFDLDDEHFGEKLDEDGFNHNNLAYFWQMFDDHCTFEKNIKIFWDHSFRRNVSVVFRINSGEYNFNDGFLENLKKILEQTKTIIQSSQRFVVYLPNNKFIGKEDENRYLSQLVPILEDLNIKYAIGNLSKINKTSKQLVVMVLDMVTNKQRLKFIVKSIRNKRQKEHPIISYISLMKIYDLADLKTSLKLYERKQSKKYNYIVVPKTDPLPYNDDEETIMRSLMGLGPDKEVFGF